MNPAGVRRRAAQKRASRRLPRIARMPPCIWRSARAHVARTLPRKRGKGVHTMRKSRRDALIAELERSRWQHTCPHSRGSAARSAPYPNQHRGCRRQHTLGTHAGPLHKLRCTPRSRVRLVGCSSCLLKPSIPLAWQDPCRRASRQMSPASDILCSRPDSGTKP